MSAKMNPASSATSKPVERFSIMLCCQNSFTPGNSFRYASRQVATMTAANTVTASITIHNFDVRAEFRAAAPVASPVHSDVATVAEILCQKSDVAIYDLTPEMTRTRLTPEMTRTRWTPGFTRNWMAQQES